MIKDVVPSSLFIDISALIETSKSYISEEFNKTYIILAWNIGTRISQEILAHKRAIYGKSIMEGLANELRLKYGPGFDKFSLSRMVKFSTLYSDKSIVVTLSQQLSWSHIIQLIAINDELKRDFYIAMCSIEHWSVRTLRKKINDMLFERSAIAKKPENLIRKEIGAIRESKTITPDFIFRDPYFLNFTGLDGDYSESDLENAILDELVKFIQEFGNDFCFVTRQKRMSTENKDRYLDLLFFHRGLRRLIAVELKIGSFEPAHKGQMEWYLNWLDKNVRHPGEERPLGIILCADKDQEDVEYLELDATGIHVAQYLTQLPPRELLEKKLRAAIQVAQNKYNQLQLPHDDEG